jgi:hypothetical protein
VVAVALHHIMDLILEDILDGVVHRIQDTVAPRVQNAAQNAGKRFRRAQQQAVSTLATQTSRIRQHQHQPPSTTDILYITDRLLVSSRPATAANPTFDDSGRDQGAKGTKRSRTSRSAETVKSETAPSEKLQEGQKSHQVETGPGETSAPSQGTAETCSDEHQTLGQDAAPTTQRTADGDGACEKRGEHADDQSGSATTGKNGENPQDGTGSSQAEDDESPATEEHETGSTFDANVANNKTSAASNGVAGDGDDQNLPEEDSPDVTPGPDPPDGGGTVTAVDDDAPTGSSNDSLAPNRMGVQQSAQNSEKMDPFADAVGRSELATPTTVEETTRNNDSFTKVKEWVDGEESFDADNLSNTGQLSASSSSMSSDKVHNVTNSVRTETHGSIYAPASSNPARLRADGRVLNSPGDMATYFDNRHGKNHYLMFSLMNEAPDDRALLIFRRQIVQLGWWSACLDRSALPSIPKILRACYAIHAYLELDAANVALVYCENGRSRSGVVAACYLRFAGLVERTEEGFLHFLSKVNPTIPADTILGKTPPSLRRFFYQFDEVIYNGGFLNRKPLLLKAIALQGLPVEDEPCIDIWDSSKRHVFSSHPEMWPDDPNLQSQSHQFDSNSRPISKWLDEDGFYKVNILLDGDFLLLCRFGGDFAQETSVHDPTKILFRYANNTGCLSGGRPYELDSEQVDVTKRYIDHLEDDFLVTLLFQADWEIAKEANDSELPPSILACMQSNSKKCLIRAKKFTDIDSVVEGWKVISKAHSARPSGEDNAAFHRYCCSPGRGEVSERGIALALQLTNFDFPAAKAMLARTSLCNILSPKSAKSVQRDAGRAKIRHMEDEASESILKIMEQVKDGLTLVQPDNEFLDLSANDKLDIQSTEMPHLPTTMHAIFSPHLGDITCSFPIQIAGASIRSPASKSSLAHSKLCGPTIPYVSRTRREIPQHFRVTSHAGDLDPCKCTTLPTYDLTARMAEDVQAQLSHTGVGTNRLLDLHEKSQKWTDIPVNETEEEGESNERAPPEPDIQVVKAIEPRDSSMNREAKEKKEKKWKDDQKVEAEEKRKEAHERKLSQEKWKENNQLSTVTQGEPLRTDPEFVKYFKMLKIGMPKEQVMHAMKKDGKDPSILDLDPDKPLRLQLPQPIQDTDADGLPLKDDPQFAKYFKMIKMGMPREQVLHAMKRDEKNPAILDLDPTKPLKSQQTIGDDGPALRDDPEYTKYFKMLSMKLPIGAVKNALIRDGKDPSIMDLDPSKSVKSQLAKIEPSEDTGPALKDDPEYSKYFKMLAMKLPMGAVKNALARDGKDPSIMDLDPNKSVKSQLGDQGEEKDTGIPLKDDPEFVKYFKMEKMGLPRDAVKNALVRDGKDPEIMDFDPNKSVAFQMKQKKTEVVGKKSTKKKRKVRRKKIYWNPIDPGKIKEDSMWNIVRDYVAMDKLNYDHKEFEELFTESADPTDQKKKKTPQNEVKKLVQVIDPKRSMNGGIVLARMKTDHKKIAEYVDRMEHGKFDSTQLKALKEYLADADERRGLIAYMKKGEKSEEVRQQIFSDLSETEKYMVTVMEVPDASAKLEAMLFRSVFTTRFQDITDAVRTLNSACDELRSSERLRKLMAMILTVVNQINTGGEGNKAMGFTLDALLKLNEAKAFDKKTSVLHYVVKLVKKNDEGLLMFESDISHVIPAESVLLDSLAADVKAIREELDSVLDIVRKDAERLEEAGKIQKMSLAELVEQKTMVHHVGIVPQFNKISHLTGRTSMERFTLNAKVACEQASESIENIQKKYAMVLGYFGEDEKMATGDFFGILRRFMAEWKKAVEQVEKIEKAQAKEKKRAAARAAKEGRGRRVQTTKGKKTTTPGGIASLAAAAAASKRDTGRKNSSANAPAVGIAALAAQAALKKAQKTNKSVGVSKQESSRSPPASGIASLAAEAALKNLQRNVESEEKTNVMLSKLAPPGAIATLAAEAALHKSKRRARNDAQESTSIHGMAALAAQSARKKCEQLQVEDETSANASQIDGKDSCNTNGMAKSATQAEPVKELKPSADKAEEPKSPPRENSKFLSSLSAYRKNKSSSQRKLNTGEDAARRADDKKDIVLAYVVEEAPCPVNDKTKSGLYSSEAQACSEKPVSLSVKRQPLDKQESPEAKASVTENGPNELPTIGSFLERQNSREKRTEVLRLNSDDSSVAIMAESFQNDTVDSPNGDAAWNEGGGVSISDYMGWANLAITSCDTESVRGFEQSQNLDYHHDYDDESTIASTYYDDDASIVSGMTIPRGHFDNSYFDDYQATDIDGDGPGDGHNPSVTAKVAASILFNDSESESASVNHENNPETSGNVYGSYGGPQTKESDLIDMSLAFHDIGLDAGLSFGGDVGFDDGLGGFGGHSMNDPGLNDFNHSMDSGGDFGGHQPFMNDNRTGSEKKPASSKWFGGWGGKGGK